MQTTLLLSLCYVRYKSRCAAPLSVVPRSAPSRSGRACAPVRGAAACTVAADGIPALSSLDAQWGGRSDRQLAGTADRYTGAPATASLATGPRSMDPASDQTDGAAAATLTLPGRSRIGGARRHRPHAAHSQAVVEPFPPGRIDQEGHGTRRSPLVCPLPMSLPSSRKASRVASAMIVNWGLTPSELGAAEPSAT